MERGNLKQKGTRFPRLVNKALNDTTHNVIAIISLSLRDVENIAAISNVNARDSHATALLTQNVHNGMTNKG